MRIGCLFLALVANLLVCAHLMAAELPKPLVGTDWLANNLENVSILDIRASTESFTTNPVFEKDKKTGKQFLVRVGGHIPGASLVPYKNVRGPQKINGVTIKHMVLDKRAFESLMQKAGLNSNSPIIVVTNAENDFDLTMASRMYWQIKYYGHDEVSILNGGTAQWLIDEYDFKTTKSNPAAGNWQVKSERKELLANSDEVAAAIDNKAIQLVDVRPLGQYLGTYKSSKVSEKGHIPSAKSYPVDLTASRSVPVKFTPITELQEVADALGVQTDSGIITYCNSGHLASGGWFVMHELLGNQNVKLYDGSMHQWTAEKRPTIKMKME